MRNIERNDILIFNYPINNDRISFKINYVYAKRCIALPGDSISAVNGYYKNNNYEGVLSNKKAQEYLSNYPDSMLHESIRNTITPSRDKYAWSIKNFGPIYVPRKGDVIKLNAENALFYSKILEFETGKKIRVDSTGEAYFDDEPASYHIFTNNYYFMAGDNVINSGDSRYWGFVPEDYIVGVVGFIPYAIDKNTNEIKCDRILKRLEHSSQDNLWDPII